MQNRILKQGVLDSDARWINRHDRDFLYNWNMSLELWMLTYKYMLIMHAQLLLGKIYKVQSKGMGSIELKLICVIGLVFKGF